MLQPFRLYSLENCPFCLNAQNFLATNHIPGELFLVDQDPIMIQGVIKVTGKNQFPVLLSRLTNEIITGWKPEEYQRVVEVYRRMYGASASNLSVDGKPVIEESPTTSVGAASETSTSVAGSAETPTVA